jgi:alpha-galactosidase
MVNSDLRDLDTATLALLTNRELIAIDQDKLGREGYVVYKKDSIQVLKKELDKGDLALCVLNRSGGPVSVSVDLQRDLHIWTPFSRMKDIFGGTDEKYTHRIRVRLDAHESRVFRLN